VLFGKVQVCPQRPQQRGSEPDSDVQSTAQPALLDEKLTNLGGHFLCAGTFREAEANGIVESMAHLLVPLGGGALLPDVIKGEEVTTG
jgi:spore maturation protein SpmA